MNEEMAEILKKKAKGYRARETVEEYSIQDGEEILNKKKVTIKHVPPDISALKAYTELTDKSNAESMSDEELVREKDRLLWLLTKEEKKVGKKT